MSESQEKKQKPRYTGNKPGSAKRCKECGYRIRGKYHEEGGHHKGLEPYVKPKEQF